MKIRLPRQKKAASRDARSRIKSFPDVRVLVASVGPFFPKGAQAPETPQASGPAACSLEAAL
eukprot:2441464-Pyramimonas_sp.AAC.1